MNSRGRRSVALVVLFALTASACDNGLAAQERVIHRFFNAMNDKDVRGMIHCIDPQLERSAKAGFRIIEKGTSLPVMDILDLAPGLNRLFGGNSSEGVRFGKMHFVSRNRTRGTTKVRLAVFTTYRAAGVDRTKREVFDIDMKRFEEKGWRIIGIQEAAATGDPDLLPDGMSRGERRRPFVF